MELYVGHVGEINFNAESHVAPSCHNFIIKHARAICRGK